MFTIDNLINQIAQEKIDCENGYQKIIIHQDYQFRYVLSILQTYILNSISDKINYNSEAYQTAIKSYSFKRYFYSNINT